MAVGSGVLLLKAVQSLLGNDYLQLETVHDCNSNGIASRAITDVSETLASLSVCMYQ